MTGRFAAPIALIAALAACGRPSPERTELDRLDAQIAGAPAARDPALAAVLNDGIMIDPALDAQSNANALRPPPRPAALPVPPTAPGAPSTAGRLGALRAAPVARAGCPDCRAASDALTLGALAERQRPPSIASCAARIRYGFGWARRLPAALPLPPGAAVNEAAGSDVGGCSLRVVSFATALPPARVADWFYTHASAAGWSAEHRIEGECHLLGGTGGGAAYMIYFRAQDGGSAVDLVSAGA